MGARLIRKILPRVNLNTKSFANTRTEHFRISIIRNHSETRAEKLSLIFKLHTSTMSTTTMHFGPEWMRKPQTQSRTQQQPSPPPNAHTPPATSPNGPPANFLPPSASGAGAGVGVGVGQGQAQGQGVHVAPSGVASTYSALVSSSAQPLQYEKHDEAHPFRYSKEELLRIYKEGGGKIGLGLEVERWDGVVREVGSDPIGLKEMSEAERKVNLDLLVHSRRGRDVLEKNRIDQYFLLQLFTAPLNSDLRRRQSTDYLSPLNTALGGPGASRLNHTSPNASGSPLRERFGGLRRRDSTGTCTLSITCFSYTVLSLSAHLHPCPYYLRSIIPCLMLLPRFRPIFYTHSHLTAFSSPDRKKIPRCCRSLANNHYQVYKHHRCRRLVTQDLLPLALALV